MMFPVFIGVFFVFSVVGLYWLWKDNRIIELEGDNVHKRLGTAIEKVEAGHITWQDLPPDIYEAHEEKGVLSGDQMNQLLEATGNAEPTRTDNDGDRLTPYEAGMVADNHCPDCGGLGFLAGPRGGMSQNFKCKNTDCGSKFNDMGLFGIDRISKPSPDKPPEDQSTGAYR